MYISKKIKPESLVRVQNAVSAGEKLVCLVSGRVMVGLMAPPVTPTAHTHTTPLYRCYTCGRDIVA